MQALCRLAYAAAGVKGRQEERDGGTLAQELSSTGLVQDCCKACPRVGVFRQVPALMRSWQRTPGGPSRTPATTVDAATRSIGEF